jgi:hypothetical protein
MIVIGAGLPSMKDSASDIVELRPRTEGQHLHVIFLSITLTRRSSAQDEAGKSLKWKRFAPYSNPSLRNVSSTCLKWRSGEQSSSISSSDSTDRISFERLRCTCSGSVPRQQAIEAACTAS